MIYKPREDSFLLEKVVRQESKGLKVLDVGCGSGIQTEAALDGGAKSVLGIDIDSESILFCRKRGLDVVESDLFSNVKGKFDLIVFNPPYLPEDEREDKESGKITSGGKKGDEIIVRFLSKVEEHLADDGKILLVVSSLTPRGEIEATIENKKMEKEIVTSMNLFMEKIEVWKISKNHLREG